MQRHQPRTGRYLECPKYKGRPKKHVDVCRRCRWKNACRAYGRYRQPELPFDRTTAARAAGVAGPKKSR